MSFDFEIIESKKLKGVMIIKPSVSSDIRGTIWTSFLKEQIDKLLPEGLYFKHDKFSTSKRNVLRGIHGDTKSWKLVTCVHGEIQQVVVDMRKDSSTYKKWQSFVISQDNQQLILVPPNMGNAYYVNSSEAVYHYKLAYDGDYIDADEQFSVSWNDDSIGIKWLSDNPFLSNRDAK
jgi:dTDP-4-dehydrorhamnose 3,5-epimerase